VQELDQGGYGLLLLFELNGVPLERWQERSDRLGRFFGPGLRAELAEAGPGRLSLCLRPAS
jgi:hypothetical protein